jgi:hypothetical protein
MPNNLVFNEVAEQLKTLVYGSNAGIAVAIKVDGSGNVAIRGLAASTDTVSIGGVVTVTASAFDIRYLSASTDTVSIGGTVTVTASALDIRSLAADTDTVTVTASNFDIRSLNADTDTVSIGGTVTVTASALDIRSLSGVTDSIMIAGNIFTESSASITSGSGSHVTMTTDNSQQNLYSFYIRNTGEASITAKLQLSPVSNDNYFVDDLSGHTVIAANEKAVLVAQRYLKFSRVWYDTGTYTASFEIYYNAHV